jgi:hypothetical protein
MQTEIERKERKAFLQSINTGSLHGESEGEHTGDEEECGGDKDRDVIVGGGVHLDDRGEQTKGSVGSGGEGISRSPHGSREDFGSITVENSV